MAVDQSTHGGNPAKQRRIWPYLAAAAALVVIAGLLVGTVAKLTDKTYRPSQEPAISAPAGATGGSDIAVNPGSQPPVEAKAPSTGGFVSGRPETGGSSPIVPPEADKIIKTGELSIATGDDSSVDQAFAGVGGIARDLGGFVSSSNARAGSGAGYATLVIRVPSARFEEAVERVSKLGEVKALTTSAQDVTGQVVDVQARIRNLEAQRDQILALMSQAKTVQETITIQDRLFAVTEQLEQLKGRLETLNSQTSYATLNVTIAGNATAPPRPSSNWGTGRALSRAAHAFVDTLNGFIVLMGPLVFLAILGGAIWLVVATILRRRRRRSADAASGPPPAGPPPEPGPPTSKPPGDSDAVGEETAAAA